MRYGVWTEELTDAMLRNRAAGMSITKNASVLSKEFNRDITRNAVMGRLTRLGLTTPSPAHQKVNWHLNMPKRNYGMKPVALEKALAVAAEPVLQGPAVSTCQWPVCDEPFTVCGEPVFKYRQAYCATHKEIARRKY